MLSYSSFEGGRRQALRLLKRIMLDERRNLRLVVVTDFVGRVKMATELFYFFFKKGVDRYIILVYYSYSTLIH